MKIKFQIEIGLFRLSVSIILEVCKEHIEILLVFTTVSTSNAFISMLLIIHLGF